MCQVHAGSTVEMLTLPKCVTGTKGGVHQQLWFTDTGSCRFYSRNVDPNKLNNQSQMVIFYSSIEETPVY